MDIAKYIGLFLLKNHFCYIHGLGNLELRKRSAVQEGETLQGPAYEVVVTQGGSIDDNLANFIATNESISISKASNALRDFSTDARAQLLEGKDVILSNIGKFQDVNGKITFITDPTLQYKPQTVPSVHNNAQNTARPYTPPLPSMQENSEKPAMQSYTPQSSKNSGTIDWKKVIIAGLVLIAAIVLGVIAYSFISNRSTQSDKVETQAVVLPVVDSAKLKADSLAAAAKNADTMKTYNIVIDDFNSNELKKAEKRVAAMKSFGHATVQMVMTQDSSKYYVVLPVKCAPSDTSRIIDSLSKFYAHPNAPHIYP